MSRLLKKEDSLFVELVMSIVEPEFDRLESELRSAAAPKEWMTEVELAELLQCSTDTLKAYALREENPLPYGKVGEMRRYHRGDVDAWLRAEGQRDRERRLDVKNKLKSVSR